MEITGKCASGCTMYRCKSKCSCTGISYAKFPTVEALANADVADIESIVRPCGLGKSKARDISACMKILHEQYHDNVPRMILTR